MAKTVFPISTFNDPDGNPVSGGLLLVTLSQDGEAGHTQLCANNCEITLDDTGSIPSGITFWPNAEITPLGTYYIISVFSSKGQLLSGPNIVTV